MKNKLFTFFLLVFFVGCSTNNDSNGNSTTTVVPVTPSSLIGTVVSTTQINLSWTDNSTNETGFKIERKTGTGTYALIGSVNADVLTYNDLGLTPNTAYTYRMYSYNTAGNSPMYSNEVTLSTNNVIVLPILTTTPPNTITSSTTWSGGTISNDGGAAITARGIVWSTTSNPTIALATKTTDGTGIGNFTSTIVGLNANTTYYVKAYATNVVGTAYGTELSFTTSNSSNTSVTDIDGNTYQLVTICSQIWTQSNLNVSHYRNGDVIPQVTDPAAWASLTTGAWCYYNNDTANGPIYGKLYNWYAVNDSRGLAPEGFHVPTDTEWNTLMNCLGGASVAGGAMKTVTTHWSTNCTGATNSSNFNGLPGGIRAYGTGTGTPSYTAINFAGHFWGANDNVIWPSPSGGSITGPYDMSLICGGTSTYPRVAEKDYGLSVRYLKN